MDTIRRRKLQKYREAIVQDLDVVEVFNHLKYDNILSEDEILNITSEVRPTGAAQFDMLNPPFSIFSYLLNLQPKSTHSPFTHSLQGQGIGIMYLAPTQEELKMSVALSLVYAAIQHDLGS